jgi:hypothetical protein
MDQDVLYDYQNLDYHFLSKTLLFQLYFALESTCFDQPLGQSHQLKYNPLVFYHLG